MIYHNSYVPNASSPRPALYRDQHTACPMLQVCALRTRASQKAQAQGSMLPAVTSRGRGCVTGCRWPTCASAAAERALACALIAWHLQGGQMGEPQGHLLQYLQ